MTRTTRRAQDTRAAVPYLYLAFELGTRDQRAIASSTPRRGPSRVSGQGSRERPSELAGCLPSHRKWR
jgi:hypothetical protein